MAIMTIGELLKQIEHEDKDKIVVFEGMNSLCNLKASVRKTKNYVILMEKEEENERL